MKRWIPKRRDQRHSAVLPPGRRWRARNLAFEHCEDRRMLSGSSLTTDVSLAPVASEGGFLTVSASGFLQSDANNFLLDANSSSRSMNNFVLLDLTVSFGQPFGTLDTAGIVGDSIFIAGTASDTDGPVSGGVGSSGVSSNPPGNETASSIVAPTLGPTLLDFDLSDTLVLEPLEPSAGDVGLPDEQIIVGDDGPDDLSDNASGLLGSTTRLLVIDDPVHIGAISLNADAMIPDQGDQREGGALEVATMVNTPQRAYEMQLSAVIAGNLDRDGLLPTSVPTPAQPVVAELARAVAFETMGQQPSQQPESPINELDRVTQNQLSEQTQATPPTLETVSAQLRATPVVSDTAGKIAIDETTAHTSEVAHDGKNSSANLAERIEDEHQAAQIATFAQWPTLATVIAGYLLIERRSLPSARTVQTPPRRPRHCRQSMGTRKTEIDL